MTLIEFAQALNDSQISTDLRESIYMFPLIEGLHLIGLVFSIGLLMFIDLRLVGLFLKQIPVQDILNPLRPWLLGGFVITIITGILLFIASVAKVMFLPVFYFKLLFIVLAAINAFIFEIKWGNRVNDWGNDSIFPTSVKIAGYVSLVFWSLVIIAGRLIPYLSYD
jgi:hypothetical protein